MHLSFYESNQVLSLAFEQLYCTCRQLAYTSTACGLSLMSMFMLLVCTQVAEPLLPYALAFAAGAMIYVVVDDIIPEACSR